MELFRRKNQFRLKILRTTKRKSMRLSTKKMTTSQLSLRISVLKMQMPKLNKKTKMLRAPSWALTYSENHLGRVPSVKLN